MPTTPNDPNSKPAYDPADWPPLEELLKSFTMDQILYGIYVSSEGGEEVSLVDTGESPDGPKNAPGAEGAAPPKAMPSSESDSA